jgi:hypothetical protein
MLEGAREVIYDEDVAKLYSDVLIQCMRMLVSNGDQALKSI